MKLTVPALTLLLMLACECARSDEQAARIAPASIGAQDLTKLSVEDLMKVKVTTVSKRAESLFGAPVALYVISSDEIRRSGATNVPDLLRMVPGVQVAQISASRWAISVRGFNSHYANTLLVMIDGRSVYTPISAGVNWDEQNVVLEDIDRIEIIRGPGGTIWGSNAVNGVINIVTKSALDTKGKLLAVAAGRELNGLSTFRYGADAGNNAGWRLFGSYAAHGNDLDPTGARRSDKWDIARGGFRYDSARSASSKLTMEGALYSGFEDESVAAPTLSPPYSRNLTERDQRSGWHLLGRWERAKADGRQATLQMYLDRTQRADTSGGQTVNTFDLDYLSDLTSSGRHHLVGGLGLRRSEIGTSPSGYVFYDPAKRTVMLYSGFVQDELAVTPHLTLTLGTKLEHNDYTGWELQPSARAAYAPDDRHTLWAAITRAVRTPYFDSTALRVDNYSFPTPGGTVVSRLTGVPDHVSETVLSYETGYRAQFGKRFTLDAAAFYSEYAHADSYENAAPIPVAGTPSYIVLPSLFRNNQSGSTHGFELAGNWAAFDHWKLSLGYSFIDSKLKVTNPAGGVLTNAPRHNVTLRSNFNASKSFDIDSSVQWVDAIRELGVKGYWKVDARLGWRPRPGVELSVVGMNLLNAHNREFGFYQGEQPQQTERTVYGKATLRF